MSLAWFVWVLCCHWCQLSLWVGLDVNYVFDFVFVCGLVPSLGPLWSPSCVLVCVESGRPFPQIKPKFEATWSPWNESKAPLGWVKAPLGVCVGWPVIILLLDLTNILLFTKTLISPKDHYKLASQSSFFLILLLFLLVLVCFWFVESISALQVLRWSFLDCCGWMNASATQFGLSSK